MNTIKIVNLLVPLLRLVAKPLLLQIAESVIDITKKHIKESEAKWDDTFVLPLVVELESLLSGAEEDSE